MSLFDEPVGVPARPRAPKAKVKPKLEELPRHVLAKLEQAGAVDTTLAGPPAVRRAHMVSCPHCERPVMRGLLPMPTPWAVDADPPALTLQGEALALLAGRTTYNLAWVYSHYELERRGSWHWHNPDEKRAGVDILAEHRCGDVRSFTTRPSRLPPLKTYRPVELPNEPPF